MDPPRHPICLRKLGVNDATGNFTERNDGTAAASPLSWDG